MRNLHPEVECELVLPLAEVEAEDEVEWCAEERELSAKRCQRRSLAWEAQGTRRR